LDVSRPLITRIYEVRFEVQSGARAVRVQFTTDCSAKELDQLVGEQAFRDATERRYTALGFKVLSVVRIVELAQELPPRSERPNVGQDNDLSERRRVVLYKEKRREEG
jgi:hypothetical protein